MSADPAHRAWLAEIAQAGWRGATAAGAATRAGTEPDALLRDVGDALTALAAFHDHVAAEAAAGSAAASGSVRDRLFDGLMRGFDALQAERAAALAIARSRDPGVALLVGSRAGLHLRRLALAAGIDITGVRGRLRLAGLGALALQAFRAWQQDDSPDMAATMAELDRLLERAERTEIEGPGFGPFTRLLRGMRP